ncbi:MAG: polyamine ABC transporter ATP-binding protein [Thermoprotei archaeon]|nr:MAG: polyamine ABC transporter ATP-binding protein [Thermoprotei archaeon]
MTVIVLENILKKYGKVVAADIPYLEIKDGEFFGLLGPSGSGKTTTLRIIAGLTKPDRGRVLLDGEDITNVPPEKRNLGMVFQSWALFPHLTVFENIAFGLRLRKLPEDEIRKRVKWAAELLQIDNLLERYPYQLSGGQQQRVAVARAIVLYPRALLFDEPLSNLDAKLREQVRFELRKLQKELKITSVYVTHDQAEAFAICDRIAIMNFGKIEQVGAPEEIYSRPKTKFVAEFIGITRFIDGKVEEIIDRSKGLVKVVSEDGLEIISWADLDRVDKGKKVSVVVRPDYISLASKSSSREPNVFKAIVDMATYVGDIVDYEIRVGKWRLRFRTPPTIRFGSGEEIYVKLDENKLIAIPTA